MPAAHRRPVGNSRESCAAIVTLRTGTHRIEEHVALRHSPSLSARWGERRRRHLFREPTLAVAVRMLLTSSALRPCATCRLELGWFRGRSSKPSGPGGPVVRFHLAGGAQHCCFSQMRVWPHAEALGCPWLAHALTRRISNAVVLRPRHAEPCGCIPSTTNVQYMCCAARVGCVGCIEGLLL